MSVSDYPVLSGICSEALQRAKEGYSWPVWQVNLNGILQS